MDELLDIVDDNDLVIGQKMRSEIYINKLSNFRVINAFIINDKGQLWIPRRTASKKLFPLHLDCSVGGHVSAGESYDDAFKRELKEELNLEADLLNFTHIGKMNPINHNVSAFMNVYLINYNSIPNYNKLDYVEYYWLKPKELLTRLSGVDCGKCDLPKIITHFFDL